MFPLLLDSRPFGGPTDIAVYATAVTVFGWYLLEAFFVARAGGARVNVRATTDRGTYLVAGLLQLSGLGLAILLGWLVDDLALPDGVWIAGVVAAWLGIFLRMWSIQTLGPYFKRVVVVQADHKVVDYGPYRFVRHPSYTGILLFIAGVGIMQANVLSIIVAVVLPFIGYYRRMKVEEKVLDAELGEPYKAFSRTRRRLVPGVW